MGMSRLSLRWCGWSNAAGSWCTSATDWRGCHCTAIESSPCRSSFLRRPRCGTPHGNSWRPDEREDAAVYRQPQHRHGRRGVALDRSRQAIKTRDFDAFARRIVRAYARRVADGDIEALPALRDLVATVDTALQDAVLGLRGSATPGPTSR